MARSHKQGIALHDFDDNAPVQCWLCKHYTRDDSPFATCKAFPSQIPAEIRANRIDHRKPWIDPMTGEPGDVGMGEKSITFEPADDAPPHMLANLYRDLNALGK